MNEQTFRSKKFLNYLQNYIELSISGTTEREASLSEAERSNGYWLHVDFLKIFEHNTCGRILITR